jgi:hypothetical protein
MTSYRRNFVPGGCQFFTVNLADRKSRLLTDHVDVLRAAFHYRPQPASIYDRCHCRAAGSPSCNLVLARRRCRFCDTLAADQKRVFPRAASMRANLAKSLAQGGARHLATALLGAYHSRRARFSPHRVVRRGVYPIDWGGDITEETAEFGKR